MNSDGGSKVHFLDDPLNNGVCNLIGRGLDCESRRWEIVAPHTPQNFNSPSWAATCAQGIGFDSLMVKVEFESQAESPIIFCGDFYYGH